MSIAYSGDNITFPDASTQNTAATGFGFKNRIINGAMVIDQRNAGASVTITNTGATTYTLDRWAGFGSVASKFSIQQTPSATETGYATRVAAGFVNYLGATSASAYTVGAAEAFYVSQIVEGANVADLGWGTASAKSITLSFLVRSSLTGTFGGALRNAAFDRSYPFSYTISAANTWEQKSVTIAGDTSGAWVTNSGTGINLDFGLGNGSSLSNTAGAWVAGSYSNATGATSVVGTSGATFYITGVQLEKGSTATSFDYKPYSTELALCQRYAYGCNMTMGNTYSAGNSYGHPFKFPVTMRSTPSLASGAIFTVNAGSAGTPSILVATGAPASPDGIFLYNNSSNWTVGAIAGFTGVFTAEL